MINRVKAWSKKWNEKGDNDVDTQVYNEDSHTGKCKPLVKTHRSACSAACDLVAFCPNVNNMGLPAVTSPQKEHPSHLGICTDCIIEALDKALRNNMSTLTKQPIPMLDLTKTLPAMGPNHTCDYVDVFMPELDRKLVSTCPVPLLSLLLLHHLQEQYRYLDWSWFYDDGFVILLESEHLLSNHSQAASSRFTCLTSSVLFPAGKWQPTWMSLSLKDGKITTSVFSKHNHSYLPSSSRHFPVVFKGCVQGIGTGCIWCAAKMMT